MKIVCDACSAKYSIADEKVRGKVFKIRCKKCSNVIVVRGVAGDKAQQGFDQKETRVFDYSGYDRGDEEGPVWHIVVDQEQVGPMPAEEVRERFRKGEIQADSYIWREGFSDWKPLNTIDPFKDIENQPAGGAQPAAAASAVAAPAAAAAASSSDADNAVANMFGGPEIADSEAAKSDPADLFSTAGSDSAGAANDLFGSSEPASGGAPADDGLGGAAAASGALGDDLFGGNGADESVPEDDLQLRGQRNENSVLFSLNNLAALAGDSAPSASAAAPVASAPASSSPSVATAAPGMAEGEGSGLIDIRSMANAYLGEKQTTTAAPPSDDLPVFGQSSFNQPAAVLLPSTAPAPSNNKVLYGLLAAIGLLAIVAIVLVFVVIKGGDKGSSADTVASAKVKGVNDLPTDRRGPNDSTAQKDPDKPKNGTADPTKETTKEPVKETTKDPVKETTKDPVKEDPKKPAKKETRKERRERERKERERRERERKERESKPKPTPKPPSGKCLDEVGCLLASPRPSCCSKYGRKPSTTSSTSKPSSNLPEKLTRSDISKGISGVRSRVNSCGSRYSAKGKVTVRVKVAPSGRVSSVSTSGAASGQVGSCVASAVKRARFPKTQRGGSFKYPFIFR